MRTEGLGARRVTLLVVALLLESPLVAAQVVDLTARTVFHDYRIGLAPNSDLGSRTLSRFYAAVAGGAYQLGPDGQFDVIASVRYDTDFGTGFRADTPFGAPIPAVDGRHDVDILFLHLDWRNMIGREFDLRVGRQVHVDDLDFFIFDGLKLIGHLWREGRNHFDLDLFAGSPVRFDAVFGSTEALLGDGTEVYDGETPFGGMALGASAFLRVASHLTLSASWRNEVVFREDEIVGFGPTVVASGPQAGTPFVLGPDLRREAALASAETVGLQVSLLGASIGFELPSIGVALSAGGVVDLLAVRLDQARLGLTWSPQPNLRLELEGFRLRPRFVGDSIFNWFAAFPYDRAQFGVTVEDFGPRLRLRGHWFAQRFTDGDQDDGLHGPSLRLEWRERTVGLHVFSEGGFHFGEATAIGGDWLSAGAGADVTLLGGRLRLDGRVSWAAVGTEDRGLDPSEGATTTLAVGAQGELTHWLRAQTYYAHTFQGLVDGQHRLFVELAARYR